jgi:hypothetical protein
MSDLRSLAVDVVAGILVFALGFGTRQIYSWWRSLSIGRFWRPVGSHIELVNEDEVNPPVLLDNMNSPGWRLQPSLDGGRVIRDFGVLIRARNPRDPQSWIVIIAGCLGFGTWAGVRLTLSPELAHSPAEFECVYRTQDDRGTPAEPVLVTGVRRLAGR